MLIGTSAVLRSIFYFKARAKDHALRLAHDSAQGLRFHFVKCLFIYFVSNQVWDLTLKMLGKSTDPMLNAKAAETHGLLLFAVDLLQETMPKFEAKGGETFLAAQFLLASGRAAVALEDVLIRNPREIPREEQRLALNKFIEHTILYLRAGGTLVPKHHLMCHMFQDMHFLGNARYYMTYRDESLNRVIARIAKSCHRMTFYTVVHNKHAYMDQLDSISY